MIKAIIFDYDGVIVDSFPDVHRVYQIICKQIGKDCCPEDFFQFKDIYGENHAHFYNRFNFTEKERKKADQIFKKEIMKQDTKMFNGIAEVLKTFHKKYRLILITSNYKDESIKKLEKFDIKKYFNEIIGKESFSGKRFEKVSIIKKILKDNDYSSDNVILVGDRNIDFEEGISAGLKKILLVDYGWGYNKEKIPQSKQKSLLKKPLDLIKAVKELEEKN